VTCLLSRSCRTVSRCTVSRPPSPSCQTRGPPSTSTPSSSTDTSTRHSTTCMQVGSLGQCLTFWALVLWFSQNFFLNRDRFVHLSVGPLQKHNVGYDCHFLIVLHWNFKLYSFKFFRKSWKIGQTSSEFVKCVSRSVWDIHVHILHSGRNVFIKDAVTLQKCVVQ